LAALDNVLTISTDGNSGNPNDHAGGGIIRFTFDMAQYIRFVEILDVDEGAGGTVSVYDAGGTQIASVPMQDYGNNSYRQVAVFADGVYRMDVEFPGSGAVPSIPFCEDTPTAAELGGFEANDGNGAIELVWETAVELDTMGFNVYRAESVIGLRTALNSSLIASQAPGSPVGTSYRSVDTTARPGVTYYYWLQELDINFETAEYGPVRAQLGFPGRIRLARPRLSPARATGLSGNWPVTTTRWRALPLGPRGRAFRFLGPDAGPSPSGEQWGDVRRNCHHFVTTL
jgi:hypothetical protein